MSKAGLPYWMAVKHITRYLKGSVDFKLYLGGKDIVLKGFCDANCTGDAKHRRLTTWYIFFVGVGVIS